MLIRPSQAGKDCVMIDWVLFRQVLVVIVVLLLMFIVYLGMRSVKS